MSLGGIAIAIGAMVDAAIVMIENAHKHIERWREEHPDREPTAAEHWALIAEASVQVGPALFFSLLIITLSFIPIFTLEAQEGRLFAPLAFTKTYAMAAAAGLAVTLVPVLMGYFIRGRIPRGRRAIRSIAGWCGPIVRCSIGCWRGRVPTIGVGVVLLALTAVPILRLGGEFMPPLDEGDLLHMPSALPGLSAGKASQLLQQMDRHDHDGARGRAGLRQDGPRGNRDRSCAARDGRNHGPVQAARPVASRHDAGEARSRSSIGRSRSRGSRTSGSRRSAIASTCSRRASRVPSASRSPAPTREVIDRSRAAYRAGGPERARRHAPRWPSG